MGNLLLSPLNQERVTIISIAIVRIVTTMLRAIKKSKELKPKLINIGNTKIFR
jgi:hypothetical protein